MLNTFLTTDRIEELKNYEWFINHVFDPNKLNVFIIPSDRTVSNTTDIIGRIKGSEAKTSNTCIIINTKYDIQKTRGLDRNKTIINYFDIDIVDLSFSPFFLSYDDNINVLLSNSETLETYANSLIKLIYEDSSKVSPIAIEVLKKMELL